jgi:alpha-D-ribose 1-methylphosphonate 5-triphosphate synthase subunit PhnL
MVMTIEKQTPNDLPMRLSINGLHKYFQLHLQNETHLQVFENMSLTLNSGECAVLAGPSGMGKSTLLKCLYGNYKINEGEVFIHFDNGDLDLANTTPQWIYYLRENIIGYVSQFLRIVPRVAALDIVMEPLLIRGVNIDSAKIKASQILTRLNIPESLWQLSPTTFSGGEQQRINIARVFVADYPILLLDEPTASLDQQNSNTVIELIKEAQAKGSAILGIFHDQQVCQQVANRVINLSEYTS